MARRSAIQTTVTVVRVFITQASACLLGLTASHSRTSLSVEPNTSSPQRRSRSASASP